MLVVKAGDGVFFCDATTASGDAERTTSVVVRSAAVSTVATLVVPGVASTEPQARNRLRGGALS